MASGIEEAGEMPGMGGRTEAEPQASPRSKRAEIVAVATEYFGEKGYEDTKWAEVAEAVGLGPTALYHYFESKQQCLFEILGEAIGEARAHFLQFSEGEFTAALEGIVRDSFELDDRQVLRARVLVAEQGLTRHARAGVREETSRMRAFSLVKEYEAGWRDFLAAGMATGAIPTVDPDLLARAVIGTYNSVWLWFRPDGRLTLPEVADFYAPRLLALAGLPSGASGAG